MKLSDLKEDDRQLDELLPAIGAIAGGAAKTVGAVGSAALKGGAALAKGVGSAMVQGAKSVGQTISGQPIGGLDPAQAAMAAKEQQEKKKEIQDAIKQKQQELTDLQKELAQLG